MRKNISMKRAQSRGHSGFAKVMTIVALLLMAATGARAAWTGGTYTATATENLGAITVNGDATLTINSDVTVNVTGGITVASGTLTVTGPGTLVVTGAKGNDGDYGGTGGTGGTGGVAISGNIIVQGGATVTATGGTGGKGGNGEEEGGNGGKGGNAFAGTLTYKSGTVTANGGSGGSRGWGPDVSGSSGSAGKAFANDVDFTQTTGYSVTNGTSTIGSVLNQTKVVISGGTPIPTGYSVSLKSVTEDATNWQGKAGEGDYQSLPLEGLEVGTAVSVKYSGTKKVKSVKAVSTGEQAPSNFTANDDCTVWTLSSMPDGNVEIEAEYFDLTAPTATEGDIYAGSTTPLVTGGSSTDGTLYYKVTNTNSKPESTEGFSATVTAQDLTAGTYYVWYYINSTPASPIADAAVEVTVKDTPENIVAAMINDLPAAANVTTDDYAAINAARAAYEALTPEQQAAVPADVVAKLQAAEAAMAFTVTLNTTGNGGTAQLLDEAFKPLGETVKVTDRFVLMVDRNEEYDFMTTFSTGDDTKDFMTEFTEEEYAAFMAYAQENGMSLSMNTVLLWVTMPRVDGNSLNIEVGFEKEKTYTVLYKRTGSEAGVVGCKMARTVNGQEEVSYSLLQRGASLGDAAVWTMTMTSAFDPTKVAFYEAAVPQGQSDKDAFANALEGATLANATISANAGTWNSVTGGGQYLIIHGLVKVVTASFVADANAVTTMKDCTFDVATTKGGVTYQLAVCKTDAAGNVTEAGTVNAPAAPTAPEGKVFAGWRGYEYDGLGRATEKIYAAGATGISVRDNVTFSAVWNPVQVTTTFAMNGGTGTTTSATVNYGETLGDISTPTRKGFVLDRWTVAKAVTESGVVFGKGATFNMNTALTANLSLTAQWKHVHEYTSYQISQFGDALKNYQKYNGYLHIAICGCDDVDIVEHEFNPAGKCACGYSKPSPTNVEVETFYGKKEGNTYTNYMNGFPEYPLRGSEVTIEAPHNWGDPEFKTWEYSTDGGTTWYELAAYEIVGFLAPCNMKARAIYVNPVQTPTVELTTSEYLQDTEYEGQTYKMGNILYQMNYKLPDGYKMLGGGIRMGDNSGISYYFEQTVKTSFDNESKGIIGAMGAGIAGLGMLTGGVDIMTLKNLGEGAFAEQYSTRYLETEENVMQKEKMTAATLAKKMMENTPVNVDKYPPIYWDATVPTRGLSGSACTLPPLRFAQKNNQDHYIYGVAYITYQTPNNETKTLYTDAVAATVNHPDCHVVKEEEQPSGARMMSQQREAAATRRAPMREPSQQQPAEQVDMSSIMAPQTQLTVYVDGEYNASLSDTYGYGETISLTAPTVSGKSFSYWTADGSVVSNSTTLKMTINANTTLRAVYDAEAATATAAITSVSRTGDGTQINVQAIANGTIDGAGFVYSTTATEPTINGDGVTNVAAVKYSSLNAQSQMPASILDKNNCWSLKITAESADAVYYVRAYATVGGNITYGDVKEVKLSSLKSGLKMVANLDAFEEGLDDALANLPAPDPTTPATTDIVVTANQAITNGAYWATFYTTEGNYQVPTGTEVYAITLSNGKLTMNPVADGIVNSGLAVVLKAKTGSLTMTKTETNSTFQGTSSLNGTLTEINGNANGNIYVLNTGTKGAGFYKLADDGTVPANKAYLVYDGAAGARDYFLFDETTAISAPLVNSEEVNSEVYDLQGRRVKNAAKGVYIVNGRKVVIK